MPDLTAQLPAALAAPHFDAVTITPGDATDLTTSGIRSVYVGGAGNITCRLLNGSADVVFTAVPVGTVLRICPSFIRATGTTATLMIGLK